MVPGNHQLEADDHAVYFMGAALGEGAEDGIYSVPQTGGEAKLLRRGTPSASGSKVGTS